MFFFIKGVIARLFIVVLATLVFCQSGSLVKSSGSRLQLGPQVPLGHRLCAPLARFKR
jgi:hypothetical protein